MTDPVQEITHDTAPGTSNSSVDWTTAFKWPEFCAGLKTAVAEAIAGSSLGSRSVSSNVEALEQYWARLVLQFRAQPVARQARRNHLKVC